MIIIYIIFFYINMSEQTKQLIHKSKKFMSSKDLYFLPLIKQIKLTNKLSINDNKINTFKHKSIEQIIGNKNINIKTQKYDSFILDNKENKKNIDLYNKYQSLPKIYMLKNRKNQQKIQTSNIKLNIKKHLKSQENQQIKNYCHFTELKNQQNSFNFNDQFYKEHFNKRLAKQTANIDFKINYNYSEKGLLLYDQQQECLSSRRNPLVKYIKIKTLEDQNLQQNHELEKVPQFLMKLLQPQKYLTAA